MCLCGYNLVKVPCERKNGLGGNKNEVVLRDPDPYSTFTVFRHGGGLEEFCILNVKFRHCNPSMCSKRETSHLGNDRKDKSEYIILAMFWLT